MNISSNVHYVTGIRIGPSERLNPNDKNDHTHTRRIWIVTEKGEYQITAFNFTNDISVELTE